MQTPLTLVFVAGLALSAQGCAGRSTPDWMLGEALAPILSTRSEVVHADDGTPFTLNIHKDEFGRERYSVDDEGGKPFGPRDIRLPTLVSKDVLIYAEESPDKHALQPLFVLDRRSGRPVETAATNVERLGTGWLLSTETSTYEARQRGPVPLEVCYLDARGLVWRQTDDPSLGALQRFECGELGTGGVFVVVEFERGARLSSDSVEPVVSIDGQPWQAWVTRLGDEDLFVVGGSADVASGTKVFDLEGNLRFSDESLTVVDPLTMAGRNVVVVRDAAGEIGYLGEGLEWIERSLPAVPTPLQADFGQGWLWVLDASDESAPVHDSWLMDTSTLRFTWTQGERMIVRPLVQYGVGEPITRGEWKDWSYLGLDGMGRPKAGQPAAADPDDPPRIGGLFVRIETEKGPRWGLIDHAGEFRLPSKPWLDVRVMPVSIQHRDPDHPDIRSVRSCSIFLVKQSSDLWYRVDNEGAYYPGSGGYYSVEQAVAAAPAEIEQRRLNRLADAARLVSAERLAQMQTLQPRVVEAAEAFLASRPPSEAEALTALLDALKVGVHAGVAGTDVIARALERVRSEGTELVLADVRRFRDTAATLSGKVKGHDTAGLHAYFEQLEQEQLALARAEESEAFYARRHKPLGPAAADAVFTGNGGSAPDNGIDAWAAGQQAQYEARVDQSFRDRLDAIDSFCDSLP